MSGSSHNSVPYNELKEKSTLKEVVVSRNNAEMEEFPHGCITNANDGIEDKRKANPRSSWPILFRSMMLLELNGCLPVFN